MGKKQKLLFNSSFEHNFAFEFLLLVNFVGIVQISKPVVNAVQRSFRQAVSQKLYKFFSFFKFW